MIENIPWFDLKRQYFQIGDEIKTAMNEVMENAAFSGGSFTEKFEKKFALYCDVNYSIGVNSGTSALHLALCALGVQEGDEVIVPANTFVASVWGICYLNATPVFVDCCPNTWNISTDDVEKKITDKTKGIIAVHLYGQPFDVDAIIEITKRHKLFLLEDSAQAHGAKYKGKRTGSFGDMGCFSFYPGKNLGAYGEGGAITTNHRVLVDKIKCYRDHGQSMKYCHDEIGYNMRMDGLQGAVLNVKLKYIESWNKRRQAISQLYKESITNPKIKMQVLPERVESVYHLFVITTEDREDFQTYLKKKGIFTGLHYPVPCHLQKALAYIGHKKGDFPNSEYLSNHCVSLPMFPELTDEEVTRVIETCQTY